MQAQSFTDRRALRANRAAGFVVVEAWSARFALRLLRAVRKASTRAVGAVVRAEFADLHRELADSAGQAR